VGVAMGVAYGTDVFRKPLAATGRADYFGALPNLAARVMGQGHGGQALIDMTANPLNIQLSPAASTSSGSRQKAMCGSLAVPPSHRKAAETRAGGSLRTSSRPTLNVLLRLRASVRAFTLKVSQVSSDLGSSACSQ